MKRFLSASLLVFVVGCGQSTEAVKRETPSERPPQPSAEGGGGGGASDGADTSTSEPPL